MISEGRKQQVQKARAARAAAKQREAESQKLWTAQFGTVDLDGDATATFQPSDPEASDGQAALETRANMFLAKYVDIFADVDTHRPVIEPAHGALTRTYMGIERKLGISKVDEHTGQWLPGPRSLLKAAPSPEMNVQIAKRYNGMVYGLSQYLDRDVKDAMKRTGAWQDAMYPESDNSRVVLPFWNGLDSFYGTEGGLTVQPFEDSTISHGWRFMNSSYPDHGPDGKPLGTVTTTLFLFGPTLNGYKPLGATPSKAKWQPTLYAVRRVTAETQTFNDYFIGGLEALLALSGDRDTPNASWEADRDARKADGERAAWEAASIDLTTLPKNEDGELSVKDI